MAVVAAYKGDGTLLSEGFLAFPEPKKLGVKISPGDVEEQRAEGGN
jgi:hypothetical protein